MRKFLVGTLALSIVSPSFAQKLNVKIIGRQDNETEYTYVVPGYSSSNSNTNANCFGDSSNVNCSGSTHTSGESTPARQVSFRVRGATYSLLLPDGRVAVVNCESKFKRTDALRLLARKMRLVFSFPPDEKELFGPLVELIGRLNKPLSEIGTSLRANFTGLISTVSMPHTMAHRSSVDRHWQRILSVARIRSLKLLAEPGESTEELDARRAKDALAQANCEMESFMESTEGRDHLIHDSLLFLERLSSDESFEEAAHELILQGAVLCWAAFEVFARDCFIGHINANPNRTRLLFADPVAKRRFEFSKISLETLALHGFDLSSRMGTLLAQQQDLSDVYSVKSVYQALFPDNQKLATALNDGDLRLLSLRRNLIVHHRGIIDDNYATHANGSQVVGAKIKLTPDDLDAHMHTASTVAVCILEAVSASS